MKEKSLGEAQVWGALERHLHGQVRSNGKGFRLGTACRKAEQEEDRRCFGSVEVPLRPGW